MNKFNLKLDPASYSLLIWLLFFGLILFGGFHVYYLAPFQVWMLIMGLVGLLMMFSAGVIKPVEEHGHCHDHDCHHHESHDHEQAAPRSERYFLYLLPLVLFMFVGPQPLGVQVMQVKGMFTAPDWGSGLDVSQPDLTGPGLDGYEGYFPTDLQALYRIPRLANGRQPVTVEGMIYHPEASETPKDVNPDDAQTLLAHFAMVCCAADARPISVVAVGDGLEDLPEGVWVQAHGRAERMEGSMIVRFIVERIEEIPEPSSPYLLSR